jgi:hypothetical protein
MHGRNCPCLLASFVFALAIVVLIPAPGVLSAQSDRARPAPDFSLPVSPPHTPPPIQQPISDPIRRSPRLPVSPPGQIGLPEIVQAAGTIFSGTVIAVTPRPALRTAGGGESVSSVAISFHVERAIRGPIPGSDFTISQWIGAWSGGQRYRVGDRALLFLYPASRLGLTSCVGGPIGLFHIDSLGRVSFSAEQLSAFHADPLLHGKSLVSFRDFAAAVERAGGEK